MMSTTLERAKQFVGEMPDGDPWLIDAWTKLMAEFADKETAALKAKLDAAISLHECVECGQPAFSISPIDPHDGFCWNCHKLLTVRPTLCGCAIREAGSSVCHKCHRRTITMDTYLQGETHESHHRRHGGKR